MTDFPTRPDSGGQRGRPMHLKVNMFPIKGALKGSVYFYDVTIEQEGKEIREVVQPQSGVVQKNARKADFNRKIIALLLDNEPPLRGAHVAYDGKNNLYTLKRFQPKPNGYVVALKENEREMKFFIALKETTVITLDRVNEFIKSGGALPQEAMATLDVFVTHHPSFKFTQRGKSLFSPKIGSRPLGQGIEVWGGYYEAVRPTKAGLMLNVDLSSSSFYQARPVIELAADVWRVRSQEDMPRKQVSDVERKKLEMQLRQVVVQTHHLAYKKKVRVASLTTRSAAQMKFNKDGEDITVAEYFRTQYNVKLRYPNLPCIVQEGPAGRKSMFPLEICTIVPGQYYNRKLNEFQTAEMIKFANVKPHERARKTEAAIHNAGFAENPFFKQLKLQQMKQMLSIKGRTIDPPRLLYGNKPVDPREGAWNLRDLSFKLGSKVATWAVLVVGEQRDVPQRQVEAFVSELVKMADKVGVQFSNRRPQIHYARANERSIDETVRRITTGNMQMLLCMLRGQAEVYAAIKRLSDSEIGFISQCMLQKHVFRINPQYLGNILMKINSKLGGQNVNLHRDLPMMDVPTILIGADVTHPTGFGARESNPSIVAVVGSMDRQLAKYGAILKTQPGRVEEIIDMRSIIKDLLRRFREANNFAPKRIIFFRDGVSEGQFLTIFHREVREIKAACMELESTYNPELTFIVVKKRHHIRFFPDEGTPTDRSGNVLPGTVVDNDIVHPTDFDFYLMSHAGIQGTSRPVHYYCLMDEIKFSSDKLQEFIYNLCYVNARCTRSTSLPPPVYYAHLAAYRGRVLSNVDIWDSDTTVSSETAKKALPEVTKKVTMFYI